MNTRAFTLALIIAGFAMFMVYSYIESATATDRHTPASPDSWQLYNSQVVGFASKLRLSFQDAEPLLFQAMAREMSGIFWNLNRQPGSAAPIAAPRT